MTFNNGHNGMNGKIRYLIMSGFYNGQQLTIEQNETVLCHLKTVNKIQTLQKLNENIFYKH